MKIALLVPEMNLGGVEQGTFDLAKGFVERGHTVFVLSAGGKMLPSLEKYGVKTVYFPFHKKNIISFFLSLWKLEELIKRENINILHARSRFPAWVGYFASRKINKVHFITSIHGFYKKRFYSQIMGKGERVIAVSNSLKKYAVKYLKVDEKKIRVVYNGINVEEFKNLKKIKHDEFTIGCIGRLTQVKGFQYVLPAVARLKNRIKNLKVIIVGEGRLSGYLKKMKEKLNLDMVYFKKGKAKEYLPYIDLLISPRIEPEDLHEEKIWIERTGVEAQIAGIPVITTAKGIKKGSFIIGEYAIFVSPQDIEGLEKSIFYSYQNYSKLIPLIEKAKKYAIENFSVDKMVEETLKVYEELV